MKINNLTTSEEQLMQVIWSLDQAFMKTIMEAYPQPKPHQNTVSTFLKILVEKDYLSIEKQGRIFQYIPKISFVDYRKHRLEEFILNFYNNDNQALIKDLEPNSTSITKPSEADISIENKEKKEKKETSTELAEAVINNWKKELSKKEKEKKKKKKKKKNQD